MSKSKCLVTIMFALMLLCNGCLSIWSQQASKDELRRERIWASGNTNAVRALSMGVSSKSAIRATVYDNGAEVLVDVTDWEALTKNPLRHLLALALDVGIGVGAKELIEEMEESDRPSGISAQGDIIIIDGDNNDVRNNSDDMSLGE